MKSALSPLHQLLRGGSILIGSNSVMIERVGLR